LAQVNQVRAQIIADFVAGAGQGLTPLESRVLTGVVRETLEMFAPPAMLGQQTPAIMQTAMASLGQFERDYARVLARHTDQTKRLGPLLEALSASTEPPPPGMSPRTTPQVSAPSRPPGWPATPPTPPSPTAPSTPTAAALPHLATALGLSVSRLQENLAATDTSADTSTGAPDALHWLLGVAQAYRHGAPPLVSPDQLPLAVPPEDAAHHHQGAAPQDHGETPPNHDASGAAESFAEVFSEDKAQADAAPRAQPPDARGQASASGPQVAGQKAGDVSLQAAARAAAVAMRGSEPVADVALGLAVAVSNRQAVLGQRVAAQPEAQPQAQTQAQAQNGEISDTVRWLLAGAVVPGRPQPRQRVVPPPAPPRCERCARLLARSRSGVLVCPNCG
jgi:hypothetical protein